MISNTFPTSLLFLLVFHAVYAVKCTFCYSSFSEHLIHINVKSSLNSKNPVISDGI
uniref:Uncharacterized protein n=1 Tax=Myoviridae sp. ctOyc4 TaxID=2827606 RepID=A0A8S5LQH1_9CAUD|nr:MAG TPA: hypothetical protein [Myoviridae sp. ctOyc4]